jgi:hypothetical protein
MGPNGSLPFSHGTPTLGLQLELGESNPVHFSMKLRIFAVNNIIIE